ncbi:hypothetical protein KQX54_012372 [Cotesia glomerata]|uniref:SWIM-type domain-containing protein n=1 Tax=Cotesia glomerata TaxID=32391 RepID=A0AAV7HTR9_COTGL|nr:hypothetical protein KQX54_012372 [Cotesia glomerata]
MNTNLINVYAVVNFFFHNESEKRSNCSAKIRLFAPRDRKFLVIKKLEDHQNHNESTKVFDYIVENRKITSKESQEIDDLLLMQCSKKLIQQRVEDKYHKKLTRKDLHNYENKKKVNESDSLTDMIDLLKNCYGSSVQVEHKDNVFVGLYFSTERMRHDFKLFPEIVFVDGTYKLFKRDFTLMLFVVEDGDGETQIVGVGILANEEKLTLTCLELLDKLAKSDSAEKYDKLYQIFCKEVPQPVLQYFNRNWHNIKSEWTVFSMVEGNLYNPTYNRLESLNGKLVVSGKVSLTTSCTSCKCPMNTSMLLPCKHIFAVRQHYKLPLFDESLFPNRWKSHTNFDTSVSPNDLRLDSDSSTRVVEISKPTCQSKRQKSSAVDKLFKSMRSTLIEAPDDIFNQRLRNLEKVFDYWKQNQEICVVSVSEDAQKMNELSEAIENISLNMSKVSINSSVTSESTLTSNNFIDSDKDINNINNLSHISLPNAVKVRGRSRSRLSCTIQISKRPRRKKLT